MAEAGEDDPVSRSVSCLFMLSLRLSMESASLLVALVLSSRPEESPPVLSLRPGIKANMAYTVLISILMIPLNADSSIFGNIFMSLAKMSKIIMGSLLKTVSISSIRRSGKS